MTEVTRGRVTQIMNLLNLAPDIQEEILFLPRVVNGRETISTTEVTVSFRRDNGSARMNAS